MKRLRDEKMMEPMFPRLHVNDAFKGGPRAPPRNKMALYEQLSIPSQRFHHSSVLSEQNSPATNLATKSSQATSRLHCENQHCLSSDSSVVQIEQRKKPVEDDYTVPIFIRSMTSKGLDRSGVEDHERDSISNTKNRRRQISKVSAVESTDKPSENSVTACHRPVCLDNVSALGKRKSLSNSEDGFTTQYKNFIHDSSNKEDESCKSFQTGNLERGGSISETSVLEIESSMESITPDDVVSLIGQKRFWKARRTIADQQRIFAIQVFELHKLVKVQKSVAASSHLLLEETPALLSKPAKSLPQKKLPSDSPIETVSNASKQSAATELPSNRKEATAENAFKKESVSTSENQSQPSICKFPSVTPPGPATISSNNYGNPGHFNQLQGHQYLVPVMSPSEGLVYKPYPGPCFPGQACGACGSNPNMNNFMPPVCGVPAPTPPPHCPMPFPPMGPYGYFPTYGMPIMNTAPFPSSSKGEPNQVPMTRHSEVSEGLASTASSSSQVVRSSRGSMFPFFAAYSAANPSKPESQGSIHESRPIKVVPHNSISASESAARIFRSIQAERKQNDTV